ATASATRRPPGTSAAQPAAAWARRVALDRRMQASAAGQQPAPPYLARIYLAQGPHGYRPQVVCVLSRSQTLGPETANLYAMEQILGWARVWFAAKREDEGEAPLRNGAWYPVLSSGVNRAVLEVSGQRVA